MKKNKFVLCFRPPLVIETSKEIPHHRSSNSGDCKDIIAANNVVKNDGKVSPLMMNSPPLLKNHGAVRIPSSGQRRARKNSTKTLSKVLNIILRDPPARIKGETIREIMTSQERTDDLEQKKTGLEKKIEDHKRKKIDGCSNITIEEEKTKNIPSNSTSSSSSSSCSCEKENKKAKITKTNDEKPKDCCLFSLDKDMVLLYWVVLASLATVLLGKTFAILLATLWFYIMPSRSTTAAYLPIRPEIMPEDSPPEISETSSTSVTRDFIKKKVIMEGLLQRPRKALNLLTV